MAAFQIFNNKKLLKEKIYFVAGIGTDIGKSFFVEKICQLLIKNQNSLVFAIKPIASGFVDGDLNSDSARILKSLNLEISKENIDKITPWKFKEPISPHFAAENIGEEINFLEVRDFCLEKIKQAKSQDAFLFIEAAGGVMTPINYQKTFLDLAAELKIPVLLISANYLGSISHSLSALEALKARNLLVEKVIINSDFWHCHNIQDLPKVDFDIKNTIFKFSQVEVLSFDEILKL